MILAPTSARQRLFAGRTALVSSLVALILLAAAAPAAAKNGRVGPPAPALSPGAQAAQLVQTADESYGIWDATTKGSLTYTVRGSAPFMSLTGRDASGTPAWTLDAADVWAASGTLPAALVASFADPDPNVLRDGRLAAYDADGSVRYHRTFSQKFVHPLAVTPTRLVWAETNAKAVTRLFVRQAGTTHVLVLPYVPRKAHFLALATASTSGARVLLGIYDPLSVGRPRVHTFWLRVDTAGTPRIVARRITQWGYADLSPSGDKAAVMDTVSMGRTGNRWVSFGKFMGPLFGDEDSGEIHVGSQRTFMQSGYQYESDTASWGTWTVSVYDRSLFTVYKRAWVYDDASTMMWFRYDPAVWYLAGIVNTTRALTVINVDTWAIASVPGTWADAVPLHNGTVALMTPDGAFSIVANPVAGP